MIKENAALLNRNKNRKTEPITAPKINTTNDKLSKRKNSEEL